jgi:predicted dehydrogenase/nucleoside-diphosphate-sugar epimerase
MAKVSICLIGCGAVSQVLYKNAIKRLADEIELIGVVDLKKPNADKILSEFSGARYFSDYNELFQMNSLDAAIIALPHKLHAPVAIQCLEKVINVLVEKPIATNRAEAEAMINAAVDSGKILQVGYFRRYFRATRIIKEIIENQILGRVVSFEFVEGENYSWPAASDSFFSFDSAGGGVLIDAGAHTIDLLLWWFGDYADIDYYDNGQKTGIESDLMADIIMKSGVKGRLRMSRSTPLANKYRIEFENGWIVWNCDDVNHFEMGAHSCTLLWNINTTFSCEPTMTITDGRSDAPPDFFDYFTLQLQKFVQSIKDNKKPEVDGTEGARNIKFIEDCYRNRKVLSEPWRDKEKEKKFIRAIEPALQKQNIRNIAVIGAAGFIGSRTLEYLHHLDPDYFAVKPFARRLNSGARLQSQGISLVQTDVMDKDQLDRNLKGIDVLICAFVGGTDVIVTGLKNVLEASAKNHVKKIVYLSTQLVYGFNPVSGLPESAIPSPEKLDWYSYSHDKAEAEKLIRKYQEKTSLDITVLRPGIVYGPHSPYWTQDAIESILTGTMFLLDDGNGACDTIYIDDLVEAMLLCMSNDNAKNKSFNISDGNQTTWKDLIYTYCELIGYPKENVHKKTSIRFTHMIFSRYLKRCQNLK